MSCAKYLNQVTDTSHQFNYIPLCYGMHVLTTSLKILFLFLLYLFNVVILLMSVLWSWDQGLGSPISQGCQSCDLETWVSGPQFPKVLALVLQQLIILHWVKCCEVVTKC